MSAKLDGQKTPILVMPLRKRSTAAARPSSQSRVSGWLAAAERPYCWAFLLVNLIASVCASTYLPTAGWMACAALALAVAEASTSLFHYWGDKRVFVRWPLFCYYDRAYARHHHDPQDIVASGAMGYAQWVGDVALLPICAPPWFYLLLGAPKESMVLTALACTFLWVCTFIGVAADTHRLAHCAPEDVPYPFRLLQRCGLLLSPDSHDKHHRLVRQSGRLGYFSVITGWSNRVQDWLGLGPVSSI